MIYFDNSATTAMSPSVIETMKKVQAQYVGNPSSLHRLGVQAKTLLDKGKAQIADLLGLDAKEIFVTSGGTESNNTAILGTAYEKEGKHVITSKVEHPSVLNTMKFLEKLGYSVTYLDVDKKGQVSVEALKAALREDTCLVSLMWVNNEVGAIQPIEAVGQVLEAYPQVHFHVDAVQALDLVLSRGIPNRVDLLSLSAHKFHGPRGVGLLYKKANRRIQPLLHGGGQESNLRSGTENVAGLVATARALREYAQRDNTTGKIRQALLEGLAVYDKLVILSGQEGASHILTLALPGVRGEVMVHALEDHDIYVSTTSACSSKAQGEHHTLAAMGVSSDLSRCAVRLSFSKWNTMEETIQFLAVFKQVYGQFSKII